MVKKLSDKLKKLADAEATKKISSLETKLAKAEAAARNTRRLQEIIDHQQELLEKRARQLFKSPHSRPSHKAGYFHRVLIPDSHGAHIDRQAEAAFLGDLAALQPREIVWLGDHLDCGGFLAQHHTIGFVAEMAYSYAEDIIEGNAFVDRVQKVAPKAVHYWLTGNHEHRVQRWCVQQSIGQPRDAEMHLRNYAVQHVLHLEQRGINYFPRDYLPNGSRAQGSFAIGNCNFVHDVSTSRSPARDAVNKWAANIFFGDTHRLDMAFAHKGGRDVVGATNGHISSNRRYWQETNLTDWMHGYGLQRVWDADHFLHMLIPIVDGKSLLGTTDKA